MTTLIFNPQEFHSNIAGFEPFNVATVEAELMFNSIKQPLQQALGRSSSLAKLPFTYTGQPADSNGEDRNPRAALKHRDDECEIVLKPSILQIVAQLSSKVFTGDDLCRNADWHRILITYTVNVYEAAQKLTRWPKFLRPVVARFIPACQTLKAQIQETENLLLPVIKRRRAIRETEKAAGNSTSKTTDRVPNAIDWMEDGASGRPFNPSIAHLLLSFAAIHSTADMLTQVLYDISSDPDLLTELRQEIISVIPTHGWTRAALYNLKLMDSVLKESQRLKPTRMISMGRLVEEPVLLHDGLAIPKGTLLMVSSHAMWDESEYTDPRRFDGHRFLRMRERDGQENDHQLVAAAPNHLGFGYGKHICPGRFFAANEVKIALCHMLLKYDFRRVGDGDGARVINLGFNLFTNPMGKIALRRRQEEICLDV
ncbi:cytochrome P450 monooxygenase [Penicillium cosmopolitanum]|uniref:Cytochrome P450 monooxygenase n=1 Tax=Penicillium cosmopolitanum TaxID=1131564 RepID=A0A9X0B5H2_9EURO|nr:cytochrome P450 monooxygenase [Penicillium cosmopolitanum]KAJ5388865.1 cytochrome P450 monooxygenase [Penicillium cosmopolitanum]